MGTYLERFGDMNIAGANAQGPAIDPGKEYIAHMKTCWGRLGEGADRCPRHAFKSRKKSRVVSPKQRPGLNKNAGGKVSVHVERHQIQTLHCHSALQFLDKSISIYEPYFLCPENRNAHSPLCNSSEI